VLEQNWKLQDPHTSLGGVGDLTTAATKLIVKLVDNSSNNINELLYDDDVNRFVKSHIKYHAKSSAKHILGNFYKNIYSPQQTEQPPQSRIWTNNFNKKVLLSHTYMMWLFKILKVKVMKE